MIVIDILGAAHAAERRVDPPFDMNGLPDLRASSDIFWSMWQHSIQTGSLKTLRYPEVLLLEIVDTELMVVKMALRSQCRERRDQTNY
jgi:hypothetical protein